MMGAASGERGAAYERELVGHFRDAGWGALRVPSSGSASKSDLPDVLAGCRDDGRFLAFGEEVPGQLWAIEAKSGKATTLYVDAEEVEALEAFAETWGATAYLSARSTKQGTPTDHYLVRPSNARITDAGRHGLPVAELEERASYRVGSEGVVRL